MKLTKNTYTKVKPGVTLIELTVVILVLLTLIGVLFVGAQIYREGADRSACILNIRNIQLAVRSNQNLDETINQGEAIDFTNQIFAIVAGPEVPAVTDGNGNVITPGTPAIPASAAADNYLVRPICPLTGGVYNLVPNYPVVGGVVATCADNGMGNGTGDHFPTRTVGW